MAAVAAASLRRRAGASAAVFLAVLSGAAVLMAFGSLLDVAAAGDATGQARSTLTTMASVVGGWGLLLVVVAVASALTLSVRQRAEETALLRSAGATPGQLARMIVTEGVLVCAAGGVAAIPLGAVLGYGLLALLRHGHQVPGDLGYAFGPWAVSIGLGVTLLSALAAGAVTARRAVRGTPAEAFSAEPARTGRGRIIAAAVLLAAAAGEAVTTVTVMKDQGFDAMATSGQADILAALALALLGPALLRGAARLLARPLGRLGATGDLVLAALTRRTRRLAAALMPIVLFTGIAIGTLHLQATENAAMRGLVPDADQKAVELLNLTVIAMIVLFAAILLVNTLVAATVDRRGEFGRQRLAGATPGQVVGAVAVEAGLLAALGTAAGTVASLFTSVPYAVVRIDSATPSGGPLIFVAVAALALALTGGTAVLAARRALRTPAVRAAAA